ncbi:MAG: hypothetical protein QG608_2555 [Actinomycetota bacterium]|nr:hypothetical protein [Actinomycetota bacterium]MDQ1294670.1 hypothetical protein [Actinomycetota bacterium]
MLRSFRLQNHRSFLGEAEFSLLPAYSSSRSAVTVTAIYGANAAGKSNLLDGLRFMTMAVRNSYRQWDPSAGVPRQPFKLSAEGQQEPSTFVVDLMLGGVQHVYGFVINDETVLEEWLYTYPHRRKRMLFERDGDGIRFGSTAIDHRGKVEFLAELTRPNALFLSAAAQAGLREFLPVREWLTHDLQWGGHRSFPIRSAGIDSLPDLIAHSEESRESVLRLIRAADLGITDIVMEPDETARSFRKERIERDLTTLRLQFKHMDPDDSLFSQREERLAQLSLLLEQVNSQPVPQRMLFSHGNDVLFDMDEESAGTRSWMTNLPLFLWALKKGKTLVVDEMDTSLHPHLMAFLIGLFASEESNTEGAQLLFATHNASLLGTSLGDELLKRDQIWFIEKDVGGNSILYPLTDFHPRKGENRERRYLAGSYGAVPVIDDVLHSCCWPENGSPAVAGPDDRLDGGGHIDDPA